MSTAWAMARLGDVLTRSDETAVLEPDREYREITVRLWGKGVIQRGVVTGAGIAAQRRYVARRGQFILSRIDARNGALGIVPTELDGAVVTNDFPVFEVRATRLLPEYLGWMCHTRGFVEECKRASEGTTNRVRLQEGRFLGREIPLPPLPEQRRVVAQIEELAGQIQEARGLREQAHSETPVMLASQIGRAFSDLALRFPVREFDWFSPHVTSGPRNWGKQYEESGSRFYRAQDIGPHGYVLNDAKVFIAPPPGEQGRSATLQRGDLMLVITGATVGRVSLFVSGHLTTSGNRH